MNLRNYLQKYGFEVRNGCDEIPFTSNCIMVVDITYCDDYSEFRTVSFGIPVYDSDTLIEEYERYCYLEDLPTDTVVAVQISNIYGPMKKRQAVSAA